MDVDFTMSTNLRPSLSDMLLALVLMPVMSGDKFMYKSLTLTGNLISHSLRSQNSSSSA